MVFTIPTGGMEAVMANLKEHLAFQVELEAKGIMVAAGPHWTDDEKEWKGEGMVVIRAGSLAEAKEIAARDPMHKSGARKFVVRPWFVNEGTITVKLNFSKKSFGNRLSDHVHLRYRDPAGRHRRARRLGAAVEGLSRLLQASVPRET